MNQNPKNTTEFFDKLQSLLSKKAKHLCMFPGCEKNSIAAHSISKEFFLRDISENGKIYTPSPIRNDSMAFKKIQFKLEGIDRVTTFNGFCHSHDNLFNDIDVNGIKTYADVFLQIYRSLSYEIFRNKAYQDAEVHADGASDIFHEKHELIKNINSQKLIDLFYDLTEDFPSSNTELPSDVEFQLTPFSKKVDLDIRIIIRRINFKCQVALHKKLHLRKNNEIYDTYVFVFPSASSSMLMIICHPDDLTDFSNQIIDDIDVLNFIEYCMMQDSQWWLAPSVVKSWSKEKLNFIESDYWNFHERKPWNNYDVSIFDEVRSDLCKHLPENLKLKELAKINHLPTREDDISRKISFIKKSTEDRNHREGKL